MPDRSRSREPDTPSPPQTDSEITPVNNLNKRLSNIVEKESDTPENLIASSAGKRMSSTPMTDEKSQPQLTESISPMVGTGEQNVAAQYYFNHPQPQQQTQAMSTAPSKPTLLTSQSLSSTAFASQYLDQKRGSAVSTPLRSARPPKSPRDAKATAASATVQPFGQARDQGESEFIVIFLLIILPLYRTYS